ncbi:MAG: hypothetical protein COA69_03540 [Robiginitomaculum sp.]|nr:MAG: hypothetical protein COA69_03540 [Robiginitomaculum sp.]
MIFSGILKALKGEDDWQDEFDLTARALPRSFGAIFLCIPLFMLITKAVVKYNDNSGEAPYLAIGLVLGFMALSFPVVAYILCLVFDRVSVFRPWVIVRNWAFLCVMVLIAMAFGLYLLGLLPFSFAYVIGLALYLGTLALDIRLASRVAGFDWMGSVFTAILINMTSMMVLYLGLVQALA